MLILSASNPAKKTKYNRNLKNFYKGCAEQIGFHVAVEMGCNLGFMRN